MKEPGYFDESVVLILLIGYCYTESPSNSVDNNKVVNVKPVSSTQNQFPKPKTAPTFLVQVPQQPVLHNQQYIPIGHGQAPVVPQMYIVDQPVHSNVPSQFVPNNANFQHAVQQLLAYYESNPQAKLQLLQQQQGGVFRVPSGNVHPGQGAPQTVQYSPQHANANYAIPNVDQKQIVIAPRAPQYHTNPQVVLYPQIPQNIHHQLLPTPQAFTAQGGSKYIQVPQQQPLDQMKIIPAPNLGPQHAPSAQHYLTANAINSDQHYIPAFANGQFSLAPGAYKTIPKQYYQQQILDQNAGPQLGQLKVNPHSKGNVNVAEQSQYSHAGLRQ